MKIRYYEGRNSILNYLIAIVFCVVVGALGVQQDKLWKLPIVMVIGGFCAWRIWRIGQGKKWK